MGNGVLGIESGAVNPAATDNISPTAPTGFCGFGGAHTGEALARKAPRSGGMSRSKQKSRRKGICACSAQTTNWSVKY